MWCDNYRRGANKLPFINWIEMEIFSPKALTTSNIPDIMQKNKSLKGANGYEEKTEGCQEAQSV